MAENNNETKVAMSSAWLDDEDDVVEEEETVFGGGDSPFIQGYGVHTVKIVMAKRITFPSSKVEFIEIDFMDKENKTHREKFMVRGKDGKSFFVKGKIKTQHFGVNKIKSLLKVANVFPDVEPKKLMASLYGNAEESDVTFTEFGTEKTGKFLVFLSLIDVKVKVCLTSKKENSQKAQEQDDKKDIKYVETCMKATKAFVKANPKKKSLKKFDDAEAAYVNVYRWFIVSSVVHFCSLKGLFASEIESGEGKLMDKFINGNNDGEVFDSRTLKPEELDEAKLARLGINEYGKQVEPEDSDYEDDASSEPESEPESEDESEDESEEW